METSEKVDQVVAALIAADLTNVAKDAKADIRTKQGGSFSYEYAGLPAILNEVRPRLLAQGLVILQDPATVDGRTSVSTRLAHSSGQWLQVGPLGVPHANDAQALGSAITYGRRYQLLAVLGLAADDDDGAGSKASASWPAGREGDEGPTVPVVRPAAAGNAPAGATAPAVGRGDVEALAGAPTFDGLRRMLGNAGAARELINRATGKDYSPRTIVDVTTEELQVALATWQEEHPEALPGITARVGGDPA